MGPPDVPLETRLNIIHFLLLHCDADRDYTLDHGSISLAAKKFKLFRNTISKFWSRAKEALRADKPINMTSNKSKNGKKRAFFDENVIKQAPLWKRQTLRSTSEATGIPKSTLFDKLKYGQIKRHSNSIKPLLTPVNKTQRLSFAISQITSESLLSNEPVFDSMMDVIHIDEKWFKLNQVNETLYLAKDEEPPHRSCKSKRFTPKVMFLCCQARPRWDPVKKQMWDGKIGIWALTEEVPAERNSKNRPKGTLETKPLTVTAQVYRRYLIDMVIPAIRKKWPTESKYKRKYIQQDNARPHIHSNDPKLLTAVQSINADIHLICQPPNSPDFNILDLGFFNAIQSLQQRQRLTNIDELISAVNDAYWVYPANRINRIFLTLQSCLIETMKLNGGNNYSIPHMRKGHLERQGTLPTTLLVDLNLVKTVRSAISLS
jgi:hypothetical protein